MTLIRKFKYISYFLCLLIGIFYLVVTFNNIKIKPEKVVDFWKIFVTHHNSKTPPWIWTKTSKKEKEKKSKEYKEEIINFIKEKHQLSNREIQELQDFFPSKFDSFYKEVESLLS
jgi:membrane-associated HD superfamily phosphohydrolase